MSGILLDQLVDDRPQTEIRGCRIQQEGKSKPDFEFMKRDPWPIIRDGREYWVHRTPKGRGFKTMRSIRGAATADTPSSQASKMQSVLSNYLAVAATKPYSIFGTIAAGAAGGSTSNVVFQQQIPIIPAMCVAIDYEITFTVQLTLGATTGAATLSPFAPYSAWANQLTLGGAPPWNLTEFTPWHIDETTHRCDWDPAYPGLGAQAQNTWALPALANVLDSGPTPQQIGGASSLSPGATVTNTTSVSANTSYTFTFWLRQILQRKRHLLVGAVPFGDPENRPNNVVQMYPLVGTLPEQSLFVNGTLATAVTTGTTNCNVVYHLKYIDLLPPGMAVPSPSVGFGLQLVTSSPSGQSQNNIFPITHRTAMIYNSIHHILVNGQLPIQANYFGLWDDQDQQSARWAYDSTVNTFQHYFTKYNFDYRRFPYKGVYTAELDDGLFPEVPSVTPYQARMSPDASYAGTWGIPVTPAMTTALRFAASANAPYIRNYEFGLVKVPY